ncbi:MAG TPA: kelch repeat-containing protein [Candidatus Dormibacteraeota bacterium]|nr:kelch repeat-containing protein [Candidatus Dormibacteraeota bacterium]
MQSAREFNAQVKLNTGKVLSIGGADNSGNILSSAELYNSSTGKWALTGSMIEARESFPAVVLKSGKVLVSGGLGTSSIVLAAAELYDPTTGAWTSAGSMSVARVAHTATLLSSGKVLVTGGCTTNLCGADSAVSELYDPTSNTWSTTGSLNTARAYHTAVALKTGKVLAIGGSASGVVTTSCELYDSTKGTWTNAASTNTGRYLNSTTLLTDGKVLVTGGTPSRGPLTSAELYDPTANTWTLQGNMTIGRYSHPAALLPDGTVLVAGGIGQSISCGKDCTSYIPTNKVDIYTESTGAFTATASLSQSLAYHSMTMLSSGRALEAGGTATTATCCTVQNTSSVYTPLTLTFSSTSLNFGLMEIGLTSPSQTVTVTNVSSHSVTFTSIASSGDFFQTDTCPTTMNAGQNCTITVTFTPTKSGTRTGAVTLKDNSPGSTSQTITLTGTGESLALGFSPSSLNLGSVVVGSSSSMTATLTNDGAASVNITAITVSPANGIFTQTNNCPSTLSVQQTCSFTIVFTPPDVFTYTATVSVTNSAGSAATLALSGTGLNN